MDIKGRVAQTFYVDKDTVKGSPKAFVSSIDLYFSSKPAKVSAFSGIEEPGVDIYICRTEVKNNQVVPVMKDDVEYGFAELQWSEVNADGNGNTPTKVVFKTPVPVDTNIPYCFVIKFDGDDIGYVLHRYKMGEKDLQSNALGSPNSLDGYYYDLTNVNTALTPSFDTDLKFALYVQKFDVSSPVTYSVVNRDFELISFDPLNFTGSLRHSEIVFANTGPISAQTVSVTNSSVNVVGTNTTFTTTFANGGYFIISSGNQNYAAIINSVSNNTLLTLKSNCTFTNTSASYTLAPLAVIRHANYADRTLILIDSTANTTVNFTPNNTCNTIIGVTSGASVKVANLSSYSFNGILPRIAVNNFKGTSSNIVFYSATSGKVTNTTPQILTNYELNKVKQETYLFSASHEQTNGAFLTNKKSYNIDVTLSSNNEFLSPLLDEDGIAVFGFVDYINNDATNEHTNSGNAISRYISKTFTLADGQEAEDIRVNIDLFKPSGTDVKVYAKIHNPADKEPFDNKNWTELELMAGANTFSNPDNPDDLIGLEYGFPPYPIIDYNTRSAGPMLDGTFTGNDTSKVLNCTTSTVNSSIVVGDLVRVYNPLTPNNSLVSVVTAANTTTLSIDRNLSVSNTYLSAFITSGLYVEKVTLKNNAYNEYINNDVVKYYNSKMGSFSTYKTMAIKLVLLSNEPAKYPLIDKLIAIAVST